MADETVRTEAANEYDIFLRANLTAFFAGLLLGFGCGVAVDGWIWPRAAVAPVVVTAPACTDADGAHLVPLGVLP